MPFHYLTSKYNLIENLRSDEKYTKNKYFSKHLELISKIDVSNYDDTSYVFVEGILSARSS